MVYRSPDKAQVKACAAALRARFESAGAIPVETPVLVSASALLDLYGEERTIREMELPRVSAARLVPPHIRARVNGAVAA